jgi:oxygen-independent coproporphyrinogen-3 oxidase
MTPLQIYSAHVPRYTSYPTAPHFHGGVNGAAYGEWLAALAPRTPLSLYLHIPFCDTLCWFCACHTTVVNNYGPVRDYVERLEREIRLIGGMLKGHHPVSHIHFGGGSPTMLARQDMLRLNRLLRDTFDVAAGAEMAIEIDPRGFGAEQADTLAEAGVTRASIGVQDCDPKVQRAINRLQSPWDLRNAAGLLRERGIDRLNLDLVYGLPYQTMMGLEHNLELAVEMLPSRMALFGYAHVPFFKKHQALIPEKALPGVEERLAMLTFAEGCLTGNEYQPIGLDHFALGGDELAIAAERRTLHRNFQGYTADAAPALLGFGASAISALPQGYVQNQVNTALYRRTLDANRLPVAKGIVLLDEDRLRRDVIEQIMCYLDVDLGAASQSHGRDADALDDVLALTRPLQECGAIKVEGRRITVARTQKAAARILASLFDTYLQTGMGKHSLSA